MKIYISADIEGVTGVTHWDEATKEKTDYAEFRAQMTKEVAAACQAAIEAGAQVIYVKDAHDTGRNILAHELPQAEGVDIRILRGWSGHPLSMLQELDSSFDAVLMIGYHSASGTNGSPLSHTMSLALEEMRLQGRITTEFELHAFAAASLGVPVVFVSGDEALCRSIITDYPAIRTVAVQEGVGDSTISIHPDKAAKYIKKNVFDVLSDPASLAACRLTLPDHFVLDLTFRHHQRAYRNSFYPNAVATSGRSVRLESSDFMDIMRFLLFI